MAARLNYSRFDNIECSDDSDVSEGEYKSQFSHAFRGSDTRTGGADDRAARKPKWVKLAEGDSGVGLYPAFLEDPYTFERQCHPINGDCDYWGLYKYVRADFEKQEPKVKFLEEDLWFCDFSIESMMRRMEVQMLYGPFGDAKVKEMPEKQFVDILIDQKKKSLQSLDVSQISTQDLVLKIWMPVLPLPFSDKPSIWRTFRCSAGLSLEAFQDKVLAPVMGWGRNYHAWFLTDTRDGALFGPAKSGAVDMIHKQRFAIEWIDADKYKLCHILRNTGDKMLWLYDLGDNFMHKIQVEEVIPSCQSTGKVTVLSGAGLCPPEDCDGNSLYRRLKDKLVKLRTTNPRAFNEEFQLKFCRAFNYSDTILDASTWDPLSFDLKATQKRVARAIASPASTNSGTSFHHPVHGDMSKFSFNMTTSETERSIVKPHESGSIMTKTTRKDPLENLNVLVCASCGTPHDLKRCATCKTVAYCSKECQRKAWPTHKKSCKAAKK